MCIRDRAKWAENARRLLQIFSVFFALRMLTLFMMVPASTAVPTAMFGIDGVVQIILGVAGVMGVIYSVDKDSVAWTKPPKGKSGSATDAAEAPEEKES